MHVAFFDVDHTIVRGNSAALYARFLRRRGEARFLDLAATAFYLALYRMNRLDIDAVVGRTVRALAGRAEAEYAALCERFVTEEMLPRVYPEARLLIERHAAAGDAVALVSASIQYVVEPLGRALGVTHALATRVESDGGRLTGAYSRPACFAAGKIHYAEALCARLGADLSGATFYTDSVSDLPLLARVGRPRPVNADLLLRREAARRGWPCVRFDGRAREREAVRAMIEALGR